MPLPPPFQKWGKAQALLYRGAVSVLAGPPGSGKTISALNIVRNLNVPTQYESNDSTRYTIAKRTYSMITGADAALSASIIENRPQQAAVAFSKLNNIRWGFESSPSIEEMAMRGEAFRELYGEYPWLTVVDILMNVDHEGVAEQNYWRLFPALKDIAQAQNTAVLAVHHTSESVKGNPCPPKSAIMGKANQLPELIMTQIIQNEKMFYAVVKNRNGPSDETGATFFTLPVDAGRCIIEDEDPDEGLVFRDGTSTPEPMKINTNKESSDGVWDWEREGQGSAGQGSEG